MTDNCPVIEYVRAVEDEYTDQSPPSRLTIPAIAAIAYTTDLRIRLAQKDARANELENQRNMLNNEAIKFRRIRIKLCRIMHTDTVEDAFDCLAQMTKPQDKLAGEPAANPSPATRDAEEDKWLRE